MRLRELTPAGGRGFTIEPSGATTSKGLSFARARPRNAVAFVRTVLGCHTPTSFGTLEQSLLKELEYLKGFLSSVNKKLTNERFIQNAKPDVIETERKKKEDAEAKIKAIEESLER